MKKTYLNPDLQISVFNTENIITTSGTSTFTAAEYAEKNATDIFGVEVEKVVVVGL